MTDLTLHVLLALGAGPAHGYAIGKDIEARSGGRLDPTTGALYQVLRRLAADGVIRPVRPPAAASGDARSSGSSRSTRPPSSPSTGLT